MEKKHKLHLKINLMSLFFIAVSLLSVTLAWFAYSGLSHVATQIGVKAWNIDFSGSSDSNDIVVSVNDIYPGMDINKEVVDIVNNGDSDAQLSYTITSARILDVDSYASGDDNPSPKIEDLLSHKYPFSININLGKKYVLSKGDSTKFTVSVSWPLDSGRNEDDSQWGSDAYTFQDSETKKHAADNDYEPKSSIKVVISVKAEQYTEADDAPDPNYNLGDNVFYNPIDNKFCGSTSETNCISTYVISVDNKLKGPIKLLPDIDRQANYANYSSTYNSITSGWTVAKSPLQLKDILDVVSTDVLDSKMIRPELSDSIIGYLGYGDRYTTEFNTKLLRYNGYYRFSNSKFSSLVSNTCYWLDTSYNSDKMVVINENNEDNTSKIVNYSTTDTNVCKVLPVITVTR